MRAARPLRYVVPPILTKRTPFRVQGIVDAVVGPARFANDEQAYIAIGVVDERVADSCASWETDAITGLQAMEVAIDPGVRVALDHINEFLFHTLGMRIGSPSTGRQQFVMDTEPLQTEDAAKRRADTEQLVGAGVARVIRLLDFGVMLNKRWTRLMLGHDTHPLSGPYAQKLRLIMESN
jgi:hypothetical protein